MSYMSQRVTVHDQVYDSIKDIADDRNITLKEAVRDVFREADYEV